MKLLLFANKPTHSFLEIKKHQVFVPNALLYIIHI
nr:MAG TPA: hypothetical protein [Caudoviricetes sp.]